MNGIICTTCKQPMDLGNPDASIYRKEPYCPTCTAKLTREKIATETAGNRYPQSGQYAAATIGRPTGRTGYNWRDDDTTLKPGIQAMEDTP